MHTTDTTMNRHTTLQSSKTIESEENKQKILNKYTGQELENIILSSGQRYATEFLKCFQGFKGGLLSYIQRSIPQRAKSQYTSGKTTRKTVNSFEGKEDTGHTNNRVIKNKGFFPNSIKKQSLYEMTGKNVRGGNKNARAKIIGDSYIEVRVIHTTKK